VKNQQMVENVEVVVHGFVMSICIDIETVWRENNE